MIDNDKKILIVGLGLIGGSYAKKLVESGYEVGALDINNDSIEYALNNGIITSGKVLIEKEYIEKFDIIIFALYPSKFVEWLKNYGHYIKKGTIILDVIGIKTYLINNAVPLIKDDVYYVSTHPMAGKETSGIINSDANIFKGANYIITPTSKSNDESISVAKFIGILLGFKNIVTLDEKEHDEMIGFLSQLTHCIAISLMSCKESKDLVYFTGDSFRDLTRIAKINENMWSELFSLNKDELLLQMNIFNEQFNKLKSYIEEDKIEKVKDMMRISTTRRKYFDK